MRPMTRTPNLVRKVWGFDELTMLQYLYTTVSAFRNGNRGKASAFFTMSTWMSFITSFKHFFKRFQ